jgi:hypothetical protein
MNIKLLLRICLALTTATVLTAFKFSNETPNNEIAETPQFKTFIKSYISAVNEKDEAKLKTLVCQQSFSAMRKNNEIYNSRFAYKIPSEHRMQIYQIAPIGDLSFSVIASAPVRPTFKILLEWDISSNEGVIVPIWIIMDKGKWYEVIPDQKNPG